MSSGRDGADVVVVGGGIVGLSIAYQVARRSDAEVIVLEKGAGVAEGSTGASSACLRLRYTHGEVVTLARAGMAAYQEWASFTGLAEPRAGFVRTGVLWMLNEDAATVEAEVDRLRRLGARARLLDATEVAEGFPALSRCGQGFDQGSPDHTCVDHPTYLFEDDGGYCTDPAGANQDLVDAARRDGLDVRLRQRVTAVRRRAGRVRGVDLADGTAIDADVVVNAAGPWCNRVNELAGVRLGWTLRPTRIQVLYRVVAPEEHGRLPLVADAAGGIYFRPDLGGRQLLVGSVRGEDERELVADPDALKRTLDPDTRQRLLNALHHRLPALEHRGTVTGTAGLYTVNDEDVHPIVGRTELEGFVVANGFSGHGFKLAPAVGALVARMLTGAALGDDPDVPLGFLAPERASLTVREKNVLA